MTPIRARPFTDFLLCLLGPAVWAAHFFILYATEALACTGASPARSVSWSAAIATAVACIGLAAFLIWQLQNKAHTRPDAARFLRHISVALAGLAMLAVIWTAAPVLLLTPCTTAA
jgi:hypothetical protein